MKNFLIAFAVFVVWSFFGLWLYSWLKPTNEISSLKLNQSENIVEDTSITKIDDVVIPEIDVKNEIIPAQDSLLSFENIEKEDTRVTSVNGLKAINQQGDVIFLFPEAMSFIKNDNEVHIPASAIDFKYKINTYLLEHPDKEIQITSIYSPKENAESPNLGIKRGNKIKEILLETGIPSEKIVVKPVIKEIDFDIDGRFKNNILFTFKQLNLERVDAIKFKIPESRIVYPRFGDSGILVNDNLKMLLFEVKEILIENPDILIEIVGHTDNVGNYEDNYRAGLGYARQVRWYLITKGGVDRNNIIATSKGESAPIDTNKSDRGRIANRRIEVIFK